jgi:hypothetical protein
MSGLWELVCHHTYSGTPGVVYDLSEGRGSDGQALGLGPSAFVADGASAGSGAVGTREDGQRIYIPPSPSWSPLGGLRVEVTVRLDTQTAGLALHHGGNWRWLMSGSNFQFAVIHSGMVASFSGPAPTGPVMPVPVSGDYDRVDTGGVPFDRWVTLGVVHDGQSGIELSIDGTPVARTTPRWGVQPEFGVVIGNTMGGPEYPMVGQVDTVKVWRLVPDWVSKQFFGRPMDDATRQCWEEFFAWLQRWRHDNPRCATQLESLIDVLVREIAVRIAGSPAAVERFAQARRRYRQLWVGSQMGGPEMAALLDELAAELNDDGIGTDRIERLHRLVVDSECYRRFRSEMPSLDCDPAVAAYLSGNGGDCCGGE